MTHPTQGGCWFCLDTENMDKEKVFCNEFDCYLHIECLKKELEKNPDNREAQIMKVEFEL
jgi:hypothetical protein